jgi:ABC-type metal ion transport system, periplasmic component/surface adhesin
MKKGIKIIGLFIFFLLLTACARRENKNEGIEITTSFYPMYEFTKQVVGNKADVRYIVPAGQEVHDYELSARDMAKLVDSDVIIYNSDNLEKWIKSSKENLKDTTLLVEASQDVKYIHSDESDEDEKHVGHADENIDPHTWLSLKKCSSRS